MKTLHYFSFALLFFFLTGTLSVSADFEDIAGIPAENAILELTQAGIISTENADGSLRTKYRPDDSINRVEFLKFAFEAFDLGQQVASGMDTEILRDFFTDVDTHEWYAPYVLYAHMAGIVQGYSNGEFRPASGITRAEALKLLLLTSGVETSPDGIVYFSDIPSTAWYLEFVDRAESLCIFDSESSFYPDELLTRADMAIWTQKFRTIFLGGSVCKKEILPEEDKPESVDEDMKEEEKTSDQNEETMTDEESKSDEENSKEDEETDENAEDIAKDNLPEGWERYTRDIFGYSFALPELWFWNEDVGEGDVISVVEAGTESEITDENRAVKIEIIRGVDFVKGESATKAGIEINVPRDATSYFRVTGNDENAEDIRQVADSILLVNDEEEGSGQNEEEKAVSSESALTVSIAEDSPKAMHIPLNANNVPLLKLVFQAPENESVQILQITLSRKGLGNKDEIAAVKIFDGFEAKGSKRKFDENHRAVINLVHDPILIEAGAKKEITIAADFDAETAGGEHSISLDDIIAIGSESKESLEILGDFPLSGEKMGTSNISVGNIVFDFKRPANTVTVGDKAQELAEITIAEEESIEDVLVHAITLSFSEISDGDLTNLFLDFRGEKISNTVEQTENGRATFFFTGEYENGLSINQSRQKTLRVLGDVSGGVGESFEVYIDDLSTDVIATGKDSGFQ